MKILHLSLENFKPFRRLKLPEEGEFPEGLILVRGPNSTGKSSLFEAILWALWGSNAVPLKNEELVNATSTYCRVVLVFEVDGTRFKIDRSFSPAEGIAVILYQLVRNRWQRIAEKSNMVNKKLEDILHLELDQALNTLLVRQGEVAKIAVATPSDLRKLLVKVYNIEILTRMSEEITNLENDLRARIQSLEEDYIRPEIIRERIEEVRKRIMSRSEDLKANQKNIVKVEEELGRLPDPATLKKLSSLFDNRRTARHDVKKIEDELKRDLQDAGLPIADPKILAARHRQLTHELSRIDTATNKLQEKLTTINQRIGAIHAQESDYHEKIKLLQEVSIEEDRAARCPTCSKPLTREERNQIIANYFHLIAEGKASKKQLLIKRKEIEDNLQELRNRRPVVERALQSIKRATDSATRLAKAQATLEEVETEYGEALSRFGVSDLEAFLKTYSVTDLSELHARIAQLETQKRNLETSCKRIEEEIEEETRRIEELEKQLHKMVQLGAEIDELKSLIIHAKFVRLNLVNSFISNWVFQKRLIGIIRSATTEYVREFTNGQYSRIDLIPKPAAGRAGPGLIFEIEDQRDHLRKKKDQLSFGDRTAISLALRLGISRTMSAIRPLKDSPALSPRVRCVLLDEPLGGLDRNRRESVVQNLVNDKSFIQIFLITHTDIQHLEGVPVITVEKSDSTSTAILTFDSE